MSLPHLHWPFAVARPMSRQMSVELAANLEKTLHSPGENTTGPCCIFFLGKIEKKYGLPFQGVSSREYPNYCTSCSLLVDILSLPQGRSHPLQLQMPYNIEVLLNFQTVLSPNMITWTWKAACKDHIYLQHVVTSTQTEDKQKNMKKWLCTMPKILSSSVAAQGTLLIALGWYPLFERTSFPHSILRSSWGKINLLSGPIWGPWGLSFAREIVWFPIPTACSAEPGNLQGMAAPTKMCWKIFPNLFGTNSKNSNFINPTKHKTQLKITSMSICIVTRIKHTLKPPIRSHAEAKYIHLLHRCQAT